MFCSVQAKELLICLQEKSTPTKYRDWGASTKVGVHVCAGVGTMTRQNKEIVIPLGVGYSCKVVVIFLTSKLLQTRSKIQYHRHNFKHIVYLLYIRPSYKWCGKVVIIGRLVKTPDLHPNKCWLTSSLCFHIPRESRRGSHPALLLTNNSCCQPQDGSRLTGSPVTICLAYDISKQIRPTHL